MGRTNINPTAFAGGVMYISTPGTQPIATGGTFQKIDGGAIAYTAGHLENFVHADGKLTYTGKTAQHIAAFASVSIESGENAQTVKLRIAKNGTSIAGSEMERDFTAVNRHSAIPLCWCEELARNDYIEVFTTSTLDNDDIIFNNMVVKLILHRQIFLQILENKENKMAKLKVSILDGEKVVIIGNQVKRKEDLVLKIKQVTEVIKNQLPTQLKELTAEGTLKQAQQQIKVQIERFKAVKKELQDLLAEMNDEANNNGKSKESAEN